MRQVPGEAQDTPFKPGEKVTPTQPATAPRVEHVRGSIDDVDGKRETRGYVPGSGK